MTTQTIRKFLFYFAATAWLLGLIVHILALAHFDISDSVPFVWVLHIGIFVVWIPTVFYLDMNEELNAYKQSNILNRFNTVGTYKIIFRQTPLWLTILAIACGIYSFINFLLFMTSHSGTPGIEDGQYILHDHGHLIKTLTEQEYHRYQANELRGFSGHWLVFYGFAAAILFPFHKQHTNE